MLFSDFVKVSKHTGLWDVNLTWYSLTTTHQIWLYGLEHSLGIHAFRPIWSCLIIKVFTAWSKFLQLSAFCTVINCVFTFCNTNVFGCLHSILTQFELVKHKFSNLTMLHIHLWGFWISWHNVLVHNYNSITHNRYSDTNCKLAHTKILQNFWLTLVVSVCVNINTLVIKTFMS